MAKINLKSLIETTTIQTKDDDDNIITTLDKVFYPSIQEVENIPEEERIVYATDYAIMNGGLLAGTKRGYKDKQPTWYFLRSPYSSSSVDGIDRSGDLDIDYADETSSGARPALRLNLKSFISARSASSDFFGAIDDVFNIKTETNSENFKYQTLELGEYPKSFAFKSSPFALIPTGRTFDGYIDDDNNTVKHDEFAAANGEKYVKVKTKRYDSDSEYYGAGGIQAPESGEYVYAKVEPIKWIIRNWDELPKEINPNGNGTAKFVDIITEEAIFSGIPFNCENDSSWEKSDIRKFLNTNFLEKVFNDELLLDVDTKKITAKKDLASDINNAVKKSRLDILNPNKDESFADIHSGRTMTDSEKIKAWIDAGQSVLLRGPSGIGKTERLKTLYPNLIYLKLTNFMFPEKVVGSFNLQTGQNIPPDFAKEAILSMASKEEKELVKQNIQNLYDLADEIYEKSKNKNEKVVIMLDELLNVKPAVQSLVYTLVLNKIVESGKGLKLPANTVVVATGNQKKYSSAAEDLAEPLEKRFDHILDMEPKVGEWLFEYAVPNNIHPSVIGYILTNYHLKQKSENVSQMGYFYEEPEVGENKLDKNGQRGKTNDPRGWVSISDFLYSFENSYQKGDFKGLNVKDFVISSLNTKLRDEWANGFFDFYNNTTLTADDIAKKTFNEYDIPSNINERFSQMANLLTAKKEQVKVCREFLIEHCGSEYASIFDIYYAGKDPEKIVQIEELQSFDEQFKSKLSIKRQKENDRKFELDRELPF